MKQSDATQEINLERSYHIVFSTYYRFPTLIQTEHQQAVTEWIKDICAEHTITLITYKVLSNHAHLLIKKKLVSYYRS